jgi:hypothetical protein
MKIIKYQLMQNKQVAIKSSLSEVKGTRVRLCAHVASRRSINLEACISQKEVHRLPTGHKKRAAAIIIIKVPTHEDN